MPRKTKPGVKLPDEPEELAEPGILERPEVTPDRPDAGTVVRAREDHHMPRPDLGPGFSTFVAAGEPIPHN